MNAPVNAMALIEAQTRAYRQARDVLSERAQSLHDELELVKRKSMRGLRSAVAAVAKAQEELRNLIDAHPHLFLKPRTVVFDGVKVGFQKGKGKVDWEDDDQVVRLIHKHFGDQAEVLVKTTEKPVKDALVNLSAADLKKLGVTVEDTGDVVVIKDTTAEVDKLVKALLKGAEEEASA